MKNPQPNQPCPCDSGLVHGKCCGSPELVELLALADTRPCGDCHACCDLLGVKELGKPAGYRCEHQCAAGCGIYNQQPHACHTFTCHWKLAPHMSEAMRPDKSGIMYFLHTSPAPADPRVTLKVFEVREGAFKTAPTAMYVELNRWRRDHPEVTVTYVPYGKHQWNDFPIAPQYQFQPKARGSVMQFSDGGYLFADSPAEADTIYANLSQRHLEAALQPRHQQPRPTRDNSLNSPSTPQLRKRGS